MSPSHLAYSVLSELPGMTPEWNLEYPPQKNCGEIPLAAWSHTKFYLVESALSWNKYSDKIVIFILFDRYASALANRKVSAVGT